MKFTDFYEAWHYLNEHGLFVDPEFPEIPPQPFAMGLIEVAVAKVNPDTNEVDDDEKKNTKVEIWLGVCERVYNEETEGYCHQCLPGIACGGDTYEEAIVNLANLVYKKIK